MINGFFKLQYFDLFYILFDYKTNIYNKHSTLPVT